MPHADRKTMQAFEEGALAGDGQFAIAFALLNLSNTHADLARDLCFGCNYGDGPLYLGVLEKVGMELEAIASAIRDASPPE